MKKVFLFLLLPIVMLLLSGCGQSDIKLIQDTKDLLTESDAAPDIVLTANIPATIKVGEKFDATFTVENKGGGWIRYYVRMYKNEKDLWDTKGVGRCSVSGLFKRGIKSTEHFYAFDLIDGKASCNGGSSVPFTSPGNYKFSFSFYNCQDLMSAFGVKSCDTMLFDNDEKIVAKGLKPIKTEDFSLVVTS